MGEAEAVELAQQALVFLSQDEELLERFLALSGVGPDEIRERVAEPAFQAGVLDFILAHDPTVIAFAEWAEIDPSLPAQARLYLPGISRDE